MVKSFLVGFADKMFYLTSAMDFGTEEEILKGQTIYCIYPEFLDR